MSKVSNEKLKKNISNLELLNVTFEEKNEEANLSVDAKVSVDLFQDGNTFLIQCNLN